MHKKKKKEKRMVSLCAWLLKRLKSRKETTLQYRQSHEGNPVTEIAHFERMGLGGLSPNSY